MVEGGIGLRKGLSGGLVTGLQQQRNTPGALALDLRDRGADLERPERHPEVGVAVLEVVPDVVLLGTCLAPGTRSSSGGKIQAASRRSS